jgi:hypothetical protein
MGGPPAAVRAFQVSNGELEIAHPPTDTYIGGAWAQLEM